MLKKKWRIAGLILSVICAFTILTACGEQKKPDDTKPPAELNVTISLNLHELMLDRFDEGTLVATITGTTDKADWESSDNNVVTVVDGKVTAKGLGNATITAKVKDKTDTCSVTVIDTGEVPSIVVTNENVNIVEGNTFQLDARVIYKNSPISGILKYVSSNEAVATISEDGLITAGNFAKDAHTCKITISSTINGYDLTVVEVDVAIMEDISINFDKTNLELSSFEVENNEYPLSADIHYNILSKGEQIEQDVELSINYSNEGIVNYDPVANKVTALKKGYTKVIVDFTSAQGSKLQAYFEVDVYAPVIKDARYNFNVDTSLETLKITLHEDLPIDGIVSVTDEEGKNVLDKVENGQIVFAKGNLNIGEQKLNINYDNRSYQVDTIIATKLLNNKTDFDWFMNMLGKTASGLPAGKDTKFATDEYYLLTADIDSARTQYKPWDQRGNFDGVFNGGGHTIVNMDMPRQGFIRICTGEIKNVSFMNATYNKGNNAALVCNELLQGAVMENVFIHGKVTNNHPGSFGSLVNHVAKGCELRNSIAVVDFSKVTGDKGSIFTTVRGNITNCFAVSESPASYSNDGTVTNCKSYLTTGAMIADIKANPTLLDTFDNEIWNKASSIPVMPSLIESCVIKNDISENVIPKNSELVLTNELDPLINYSLASPVNGVVIEDNVLKVNNDATVGDQIIINTKFMFDESKLVSHTLTIRPTIADHSDKGSIADLVENGGIGADCVISIATINDTIGNGTITNSDIKKVYLNGAEISPTITENNITFTKSIVPNDINGYTTLEIETAEYLHRFKVMIVHGALGTVADVTQFFGIFDPKGKTQRYYVGETIILTADIDCAPEFYKAQYNQQSGHAEFCGTFDGRGHALKNMVLGDNNQRRALFRVVQTGATIKNLALINAKIGYSGAWYASSIVSELYGTVSNCFVSSNNQTKKINENANVATGIVNQINNQSVVENCIAVAEFSGTAEHKSLIVGDFRTDRTGKRFANCYGISKTTNQMVGNPGKFKTSNLQAFADAAAFGAKVTETQGLEGTGWSEYWQIKDNALYFGANKVVDWAVQA